MVEANFNNSYVGLRLDLLKFIKKGNYNVLDIGCATGENGRYLLEKGFVNTVYGVELDEDMANEAISKSYKEVLVGNLNSNKFLTAVSSIEEKFDYIIFGDVLEHLVSPNSVLDKTSMLLKENGKIIISVPNIGHIELFIQVYLKGNWPLNERGIFDKTHLRWFTKKDIYFLAESTGLKVQEYERKLRARDAQGSKFTFFYRILKFLNKDLVTFQHILVCGRN